MNFSIKACLITLCFMLFYTYSPTYGQSNIYDTNWKKDGIISGSGIGLNLLGAYFISKVKTPTQEDIFNLNLESINSFDQSATQNNSEHARTVSDILLYSSLAFPLLSMVDGDARNEKLKIGIMTFETFSITVGLTNIIKGAAKRYRPFVYNPEVAIEDKLDRNVRLSFLSGHTSATTAMTFLTAKIIRDYNPDIHPMVIWLPAATIPAFMGYLRVEGGKHFNSDVIAGYLLGASVGYLIPVIHKNKNLNLNIQPNGGIGLSLKF